MKLNNIANLHDLADQIKHIRCIVGKLGGRRYQINKGPSFSLNQLLQKVETLSKKPDAEVRDLSNALLEIKKLDEEGEAKLKKSHPILKKLTQLCRCLGGKFNATQLEHLIDQLDATSPRPQQSASQETTLPALPQSAAQNTPKCPSGLENYFDLVPKALSKAILDSSHFNVEEKKQAFYAAKDVYTNYREEDYVTAWVALPVSQTYLDHLSINHPSFRRLSTLGLFHEGVGQYVIRGSEKPDKNEGYFEPLEMLRALPDKREREPSLFGFLVRVNGNHRTSCLIDLKNCTVEYFNSFGTDSAVKEGLQEFTELLTKKYKTAFTYKHQTANFRLQNDGYQCGIWSCKLIEERIAQGNDFDVNACKKIDIKTTRQDVYNTAFKMEFYNRVAEERKLKYLDPIDDADMEAFYETHYINWAAFNQELCETDQVPKLILELQEFVKKRKTHLLRGGIV